MRQFDPLDDDDIYQLETPSPSPRPAPPLPTRQQPEVNPYAAPAYVSEKPASRPPHAQMIPAQVTFEDVHSVAWSVYRKNMKRAILLVVGTVMLTLALPVIGALILSSLPYSSAMEYVCIAGINVSGVLIGLGCVFLMRGMTGLIRSGSTRVPLFPDWGILWRIAVFVLLMFIAGMFLFSVAMRCADVLYPEEEKMMPSLRMDGSEVKMRYRPYNHGIFCDRAAAMIVFLTPFLALPGLWLVVDRKMNPLQAMVFSLQMMLQNFLAVLTLLAWCAVLIAAGVMALGVGLCWTLPLVVTYFIVFCMMASGENVKLEMRNEEL